MILEARRAPLPSKPTTSGRPEVGGSRVSPSRRRALPWIGVATLVSACATAPPRPAENTQAPSVSASSAAEPLPPTTASAVASSAPPPRLFVRAAALPPPEDGPLPPSVMLAQKNDTEALLAFGNGSGVVVRLDTGCITEGWAFSSVPEPEPASFEPDHLSRLTAVFDDPKHALQVPTPLRAAYQAWLAPRIAEAARFAYPPSAYPATFSADQRTVLLNFGDRAFLSRDGGQTFSPVLREPNALDERLDSADLVADQYLLVFDRSGDRMLVRTLGGPSPGTPLAMKATGPDMETDVGRVGTVMHLLQLDAFNRAESTAPTKVCTRTVDLAAPTAPAKKGVCFALPGQQALRATSEKYPWSAFAEIERVSRITRAVTLVNLVKKTHKRHVLESSARPGSLHVDPTGQIAWTGEDGRSRTIGLDGKTRVLEGSGVVAGWAPPTSKHGILLVDAHPEGGSLRDHRCSLLRALPR